MKGILAAGTYKLGNREVARIGYGAMQLAGPGAFGPPKDRNEAIAVLQAAAANGVNHIDTSDYYAPHITNRLISDALWPYPAGLTIVTKVGAGRGSDASWQPAAVPAELEQAVHDNLRNLRLDALDVVNFRVMRNEQAPADGSIEEGFSALAEWKNRGLIRHLGISSATRSQIQEARRIADVVCVQNHFNLMHRADDGLVDELSAAGIAYVPFFPLGGFSPLQSEELARTAELLDATPMQVALAWLLQRSPNILLIAGTSSLEHLYENLLVSELDLPEDAIRVLDRIGANF